MLVITCVSYQLTLHNVTTANTINKQGRMSRDLAQPFPFRGLQNLVVAEEGSYIWWELVVREPGTTRGSHKSNIKTKKNSLATHLHLFLRQCATASCSIRRATLMSVVLLFSNSADMVLFWWCSGMQTLSMETRGF
jgi:hypothetical protein